MTFGVVGYLLARTRATAAASERTAAQKVAEEQSQEARKQASELRVERDQARERSEQMEKANSDLAAGRRSLDEQLGKLTTELATTRTNLQSKEAEVARLRVLVEAGGADVEETKRRLHDTERAVSALQATELQLRERIHQLDVQLGQLTSQNQALREQAAALEAERKQADEVAAENQRLYRESVEAACKEMLAKSNEALVSTASDTLSELSKPVVDGLAQMAERLKEAEIRRASTDASLSQEIKGLAEESLRSREQTRSLVQALKRPETRGRWGEIQLRRAVELSGMLEHVDFSEQVPILDEDAAQRPDMIVHLPGGKKVILDAKVSLDAFISATEATDETVAAKHWEDHAKQLRKHVDVLAGKEYYRKVADSPEYVLMFVPAEAILVAALEKDPGMLDYAADKQILIVSPMSLIASLRSTAFGWKQERLHENLRQVLDLGMEIYERLSLMGGHMEKLGGAIDRTVKAYNETVGSMESRLFVTAAKFKELKIVEADLKRPQSRTTTARPLTRPELLESAAADRKVRPIAEAQELEESA
ncbi:DNA recombination protein RmuC [Microtetraspora glauca]|uniref:DNA recombination protein RmuC n=1 Tax=Microtetraspora glauca TaxID=1996 RepID=A0ABV3GIB7_MICGL